MTFIEKATAKRDAYIAAGYTCTEIELTETSAKFSARDQYGVSRDMIFGDAGVTSPLLEKAKLKAPVIVEPPVVEPTPVKKTRRKKGA